MIIIIIYRQADGKRNVQTYCDTLFQFMSMPFMLICSRDVQNCFKINRGIADDCFKILCISIVEYEIGRYIQSSIFNQ